MDFLIMLPAFIVIGGLGWLLIWQPIKAEKQASREAEEKERQMLANMTAEEQAAYWKGKYEYEKAKRERAYYDWKKDWNNGATEDPAYSDISANMYHFDDND